MRPRHWFWLVYLVLTIVIACSDSSGPNAMGGADACGGTCQADQTCVNGSCVCVAGLSACAGSCIDMQSSAQNCGSCGMACAAGQVCSNGACAQGCAAGQTQCGLDCVNLQSDIMNCGVCGRSCTGLGMTCIGGTCVNNGDPVDATSGNTTGTITSSAGGSTTTMGGSAGATATAMGGSTATTSMGGAAGTAGATGTTSSSGAGGTGGVIGTTEGDWYVAVDGNDNDPGTEAEPFATVGRAQQAASPGDTVLVRGGVYAFSSGTVGVAFTKPGTADNPIRYFAYAGETPIFDLSGINNPSGRVTGFDITTNNIHIRGMEVTGVPQYQSGQDSWAVRIRGDGNVLELLNVHHNEAPGIFITSGSNNLILNCDSHHNYDVLENGGSGDGFGCHSTGAGNVMRGCRGYDNSDDGYDFINAPGACTVEDSWAFRNGYVPDTNNAAGNGAGFKAGGYGLEPSDFPAQIPRHVVRKCVAWGNRSQGFYANHHPGAIDWLNNTAFDNGSRNYDMLDDVGSGTHLLRNNIAYGDGGGLSNSTSDDEQNNSWNGGVSVSDADFVSLSDTGTEGPRKPDGSLPDVDFLRLATGSDLIDAGVDVGLPFSGSAPDLGAFESE